jgi:hypothetical protein
MTLLPPAPRHIDNSDRAGYKFSFFCEICKWDYATKYVEAKSAKHGRIIRMSSRAFSLGSRIMDVKPGSGKPKLDDVEKEGKDTAKELEEHFDGSAEWNKGRDAALEEARKEAEKYFRNCAICKRWVCPKDWNESYNCCMEDSQQSICMSCHQLAGSGKFCTNCGAKLETICGSCGTKYNAGTKFCGQCGAKIAA